MQTALILAGNRTQVTFSRIIPLDHQDFSRYWQYNFNEQKSDWLYVAYEKLSLQNNGVVFLIKNNICKFNNICNDLCEDNSPKMC